MTKSVEYNITNKEQQLQEVKYVGNETELTQELKQEYAVRKSDTAFLYFSVLMVQMHILISGSSIVWTSPVIPKLTSNDTQINPLGQPATPVDISMIAGIPNLTGLIGSVLLPRFTNILGRKLYLQIMGLALLVSFILLAFSSSVTMIIISRSVTHIFLSGSFSVIPIYVTEICEDHNRAKFGCFMGLFHQIGHFYCFIVGPLFGVRNFTLLIVGPAIPFLIFGFFIPESPIYLLSKGKRVQCVDALTKLRSNKSDTEIMSDLDKLEQTLKAKETTKNSPNLVTFLRTKETRIGFMLAILPILTQHLSGVSVIMSFLAPFFNSAGTSFSGNNLAMIVGIVKISCFTFTSFMVEKIGRKRMLLFSTVGTALPLFGLGCFFYLKHINSTLIQYLQWMPLTFVLLNVSVYSMGLGPIPMAIMHEMFPSEYRAVASSFIMTIIGVTIFGLTSSYPIVAATIGVHWAVWMFSASAFVGSILIYIFLPETKGKSLKEIQDILKNY